MPLPTRISFTISLTQMVALMATLISCTLLWFPWLRTGLTGDVRTYNAFQLVYMGHFVAVSSCSALAAMFWAAMAAGNRRRAVAIPGVALTVTAAPGLVLIGLVEFVHSLAPTWLTPILTNSASMALRAEPGVWAHTGLILSALTLWLAAPSMTNEGRLRNPRRAKGKVLLLASAVALVVVRALPLFTVEVQRSETLGSGTTLATIGVVAGEVPLLGLVSTVATGFFAGLVVVAALRPHPLVLIATSVGLGLHLGLIWVQVISVTVASSVVPSSWFDLLEDWVAIGVAVSPGAIAAAGFSLVGFLGILLMLGPGATAISPTHSGKLASAAVHRSGGIPRTAFDDLP